MADAEYQSGVSYESARKEHDDLVGAGYNGQGEDSAVAYGRQAENYDRYQSAATGDDANGDSITYCYMLNGPYVPDIAWKGNPESEIDAFVSEELYIHSKILIADDRVVICGSANLNDRSQLGTHDSEIAVVIEDPTPVESSMNGQPFTASKFAASLRRQLFRKHLGLLPFQDWTRPNENFMPINKDPNVYDWGSPSDQLVTDVFSVQFTDLWNTQAATNNAVYEKLFHTVPSDRARNWDQYKEYYEQYFLPQKKEDDGDEKTEPKYRYGHVVKEEFGDDVRAVKEELGKVRGTLVEMSLRFMDEVDFAKEGLTFNPLTDEIYT